MAEHFAQVRPGLTLCYESFGEPEDPPLLLIMGLGTQMIGWPDDFCRLLAARGLHVIRFDNRDCGRSSAVQGRPPSVRELLTRRIVDPPYNLSDMAGDAAALLEVLGIESAHVVGASMGGMIAQMLAAEHPGRVRSLVSIMSTTGSRRRGQPALAIYPYLLRQAPTEREAFIAHLLSVFEAIGSRGLPRDHARLRETAERSFARGLNPAGTARQLGAIVASGDRTLALGRITAPTLVIHGSHDRMVNPSGGRATARAIPGARLMIVEGMGHDLPDGAWGQLVDAIAGHAARAQAGQTAVATGAD